MKALNPPAIGSKVPPETNEKSPTFQRWVKGGETEKAPEGRQNCGIERELNLPSLRDSNNLALERKALPARQIAIRFLATSLTFSKRIHP